MENKCFVTEYDCAGSNDNLEYFGYFKIPVPASNDLAKRTIYLGFLPTEDDNTDLKVKILNGTFVDSGGSTSIGTEIQFASGVPQTIYVGNTGGTVLVPKYSLRYYKGGGSSMNYNVNAALGPVLVGDMSMFQYNSQLKSFYSNINADVDVNKVVSTALVELCIRNRGKTSGNLSSFADKASLEYLALLGGNGMVTGDISVLGQNKALSRFTCELSGVSGELNAFADAQITAGRTSGTLYITCRKGTLYYFAASDAQHENPIAFKSGNIAFSNGGYTITKTE